MAATFSLVPGRWSSSVTTRMAATLQKRMCVCNSRWARSICRWRDVFPRSARSTGTESTLPGSAKPAIQLSPVTTFLRTPYWASSGPAVERGPMTWFRRNKVSLTILIGLALIALLALAQSGGVILAILRFGTSFSEITDRNLPALIAASRLSELTHTLVATAPEIALASTQVQRQAVTDQLNDRGATLARVVARVGETGGDPAQVADLKRELEIVITNLKGLDEFVRQRIDASNAVQGIASRLPDLAARVRKFADAATIGEQYSEQRSELIISPDRRVEWSAAALECITLMLTTPVVDNTSRLEHVKTELKALVERMSNVYAQLPPV